MNSLLTLPLTLGLLMSGVFLLPKSGEVAQSAVSMKLPEELGAWRLKPETASTKEIEILAKDTDFSKASCQSDIPGVYTPLGYPVQQQIELSVVLSGSDINNSIHRPERCMPSQGHQIYASDKEMITTPDGHTIPIRKLTSLRPATLNDGSNVTLHFVTYYFFVGQHKLTEDHMTRAAIDMWDRVAHGQDQRWAYVSASMAFSDEHELGLQSREKVEAEARKFLGNLADHNIDWQKITAR